MEFQVSIHKLAGETMVKVSRDGKFIAAIYPHEDGMRIISKYLDGVEHEVDVPPSVLIKFSK